MEQLTKEDRKMLYDNWRVIKQDFPTPAEYRILRIVKRSPGISISGVSAHADTHRQYAKHLLGILEEKGWVTRSGGRDYKNRKCTVFTAIKLT